MAELATVFRRPFPEQIAAFRARLGDLVPTRRWDDIRKSAHDRAFMVAGAMKADLLADLAGAVDGVIAEGESLEAFRSRFRDIVETRGWHGWTGEETEAGRAWRTRVIYRTNMATSYSAGRLAQLREADFPFWVYRHSGAIEPRLQHLGWDGLILPSDHPFWATHFPPNGWGCGCYVVGARSREAALRLGGDPAKVLPDDWNAVDPRTAAPKGIGKGWDYAPGATVTDTVLALRDKLDRLPPKPSIALIQDWLGADAFAAWFADPAGAWPILRLSDELAESIGATTPVASMPAGVARKQLREHPELSVREYLAAQTVVDDATEVLRSGANEIVFLRNDESGMVLVVRAYVEWGDLIVVSLRRLPAREVSRDKEIARLRARNRAE